MNQKREDKLYDAAFNRDGNINMNPDWPEDMSNHKAGEASVDRQKKIEKKQDKKRKVNTMQRAGQLAAERMKKKKKKMKAFEDRGMDEDDATYSPSGMDN